MAGFARVLALCVLGGLGGAGSPVRAGADDAPAEREHLARDQVAQAERDRLLEEMRTRSAARQWAAVERAYRQLHALGLEVPFEAHVLAAHAAQSSGDVEGAILRLEAALAVRPDPEVRSWLNELRQAYGRVVLETRGGTGLLLEPLEPFFQPDRRAQVEAAARALAQTGTYVGMLPVGRYRLGDREFDVSPGVAVQVTLSAREVRRARRALRRRKEADADAR